MSKNLSTAIKAIDAELNEGKTEQADLTGYLASLDELIETARAVKKLYAREVAVEATKRSRAKKAAELAEMKARLAELEAGKTV